MKNTIATLSALMALGSASAIALSHRATSKLICAQKGWTNGTNSDYDTYADSYGFCSAACSDGSDLSFAMGDGLCSTFKVPVAGNFVPDENSPYAFYDFGCQKQSEQCGVAGWSRNDSKIGIQTPDIASCAAQCATQKYNCASYAYGEGECLLYVQTVTENLDRDSSSLYRFYDRTCDAPTTSSSLTGKTSTTTIEPVKQSSKPLSTTTTRSLSTSTTSVKTTTSKSTTTTVSSTTRAIATTSKSITMSTTTRSTTTVSLTTTKAPISTTKTTTSTTKAVTSSTLTVKVGY